MTQRITDPFLGKSIGQRWILLIPLTMRKAFPYHDVIMFRFIYDIGVAKAFQSFTAGAFHHNDNRWCNLHEENADLSHNISYKNLYRLK